MRAVGDGVSGLAKFSRFLPLHVCLEKLRKDRRRERWALRDNLMLVLLLTTASAAMAGAAALAAVLVAAAIVGYAVCVYRAGPAACCKMRTPAAARPPGASWVHADALVHIGHQPPATSSHVPSPTNQHQ